MAKITEKTVFNLLISSDIKEIARLCECGENMVNKVLRGVRNNDKILKIAHSISKIRFRKYIESLRDSGIMPQETFSKIIPDTIPFTKEEAGKIILEGGIEHFLNQVIIKQNQEKEIALNEFFKSLENIEINSSKA